MSVLELQILSTVLFISLCIVLLDECTSTADEEKFHELLPILKLVAFFKRLDAANENLIVLLQKCTLSTQRPDIFLGAYAKVIAIINEQLKLVCEIREVLIIRCGRQQQNLAVLVLNKRLYILIPHPVLIAQVMAFIHDDETIVACVVHIDWFCH